jgi:hypothetical protein
MPQVPVTVRTPTDRPLVKVVDQSVPNPAAGAAFQIVVPIGYRFKIVSLFLRFVTDANVADRFIVITVSTPSGVVFRFTHSAPIVAGETRFLTLAPGVAPLTWSGTIMTSLAAFPTDLTLEEGSIIDVTVTGIQVGDQFSQVNTQLLSQFTAE